MRRRHRRTVFKEDTFLEENQVILTFIVLVHPPTSNMQASLVNRCNLTNPTARAVMDQGFNSPAAFLKVKAKDIDSLCVHINKNVANVTIPFLSIADLKMYRYWVVLSDRIGTSTTPARYTDEEKTFVENLVSEREAWKEVHPTEPTIPNGLKDLSKWRIFWDRLDSYLTCIHGAAEVSLNYVYRPTEIVTPAIRDVDYATNGEMYYNCTRLSGPHYKADNTRVFEVLKTLTIDGPGWTFIRLFNRTHDGRAAVMALRLQAEGDAATLTRKESAYNAISLTRYSGPMRNFTFSSYVVKHSDAHAELLECGEPMPESRKVSLFMDGISCPRLATGKDIIEGDPVKSGSFQSAQSYLSSLVIRKALTKKTNSGGRDGSRNASEVTTHGKRGGKGGTTGSRGAGGSTRTHSKHGNIPLVDKFYTREEWWDIFDDTDRQVVNGLKGKGNGGNAQRNKVAAAKRRASALAARDEQRNPTEDASTDRSRNPPVGRDAHANKKNKSGEQA